MKKVWISFLCLLLLLVGCIDKTHSDNPPEQPSKPTETDPPAPPVVGPNAGRLPDLFPTDPMTVPSYPENGNQEVSFLSAPVSLTEYIKEAAKPTTVITVEVFKGDDLLHTVADAVLVNQMVRTHDAEGNDVFSVLIGKKDETEDSFSCRVPSQADERAAVCPYKIRLTAATPKFSYKEGDGVKVSTLNFNLETLQVDYGLDSVTPSIPEHTSVWTDFNFAKTPAIDSYDLKIEGTTVSLTKVIDLKYQYADQTVTFEYKTGDGDLAWKEVTLSVPAVSKADGALVDSHSYNFKIIGNKAFYLPSDEQTVAVPVHLYKAKISFGLLGENPKITLADREAKDIISAAMAGNGAASYRLITEDAVTGKTSVDLEKQLSVRCADSQLAFYKSKAADLDESSLPAAVVTQPISEGSESFVFTLKAVADPDDIYDDNELEITVVGELPKPQATVGELQLTKASDPAVLELSVLQTMEEDTEYTLAAPHADPKNLQIAFSSSNLAITPRIPNQADFQTEERFMLVLTRDSNTLVLNPGYLLSFKNAAGAQVCQLQIPFQQSAAESVTLSVTAYYPDNSNLPHSEPVTVALGFTQTSDVVEFAPKGVSGLAMEAPPSSVPIASLLEEGTYNSDDLSNFRFTFESELVPGIPGGGTLPSVPHLFSNAAMVTLSVKAGTTDDRVLTVKEGINSYEIAVPKGGVISNPRKKVEVKFSLTFKDQTVELTATLDCSAS